MPEDHGKRYAANRRKDQSRRAEYSDPWATGFYAPMPKAPKKPSVLRTAPLSPDWISQYSQNRIAQLGYMPKCHWCAVEIPTYPFGCVDSTQYGHECKACAHQRWHQEAAS